LVKEAPEELSYQVGLSQAWLQVGKYYWRVGEHERVLHACQEAVAVQRRVVEKAPQDIPYRILLDDRQWRLERILGEMGRQDEVLASLLEREKLWPQDAARLRLIAADLRKLAAEVGEGRKELSPQERRQKERYLQESARVAGKADSLSPPRPKAAH
jgi:hypothetical protein